MNDLLACGYGNLFDSLFRDLVLFTALGIGGLFLSIKLVGVVVESVFD